ncbi:MAG: glycosyltransferase [candidate division WOR-3 bacterium]
MRILWVFRGYLDERMDRGALVRMAEAVTRTGNPMFLITGYRRVKDNRSPVIYIRSSPLPFVNHICQAVSAWLALLRHAAPGDAIMAEPYMALSALPFALLARWGLCKYRVILDVRTLPVERGRVFFALDRVLFRLGLFLARAFFSGATVITPAMARFLRRELRGLSVGVWGSGVDPEVFDPSRYDREAERKRWGFEEEKVFLYHGALSSRGRGLLESVRAFVRARPDNAILVFAGDGELKERIKQEGGSLVRVIPPVAHEDVPSLLAASDFVVIPFLRTPVIDTSCPVKLLEALAMEKPVVGTDVPPLREVLDSKGFWFKAQGPDGLDAAFRMALNAGSVDARGGRALACGYSFSVQAERLLGFISQI